MSNIQIITDSTAYIRREYAEANNIKIVPLSVTFCGETKDEGFPGEFAEFFEKLRESKDFPTTSQPSVGAFTKVYDEALKEGKEVIVITISAKLSGTYSSAYTAAEIMGKDKISVIDSETAASNLRILVEIALKLAEEGMAREEIVKILEEEKKKSRVELTVDTLDYLKKGGRLSGTQAFIGSILNIKPVIALIDGKLEPIGKVRGKNKAIEMMISNIPHNVKAISICHILNIEEAEEMRNYLVQKFPRAVVAIDELGSVVGAHLGPKAVGICYKW